MEWDKFIIITIVSEWQLSIQGSSPNTRIKKLFRSWNIIISYQYWLREDCPAGRQSSFFAEWFLIKVRRAVEINSVLKKAILVRKKQVMLIRMIQFSWISEMQSNIRKIIWRDWLNRKVSGIDCKPKLCYKVMESVR